MWTQPVTTVLCFSKKRLVLGVARSICGSCPVLLLLSAYGGGRAGRFRGLSRPPRPGGDAAGLSRYASLGIDLSVWPENKPIVIGEVAGTNSHKSRQSLIVDWIRRQKPYVRDVLRTFTRGGHRIIVGTPRSVADDMEGWFRSGAADGFNIMFTSAPDGIRDVVSLLCPELQRRGLLPEGYEGGSLRETLGLA